MTLGVNLISGRFVYALLILSERYYKVYIYKTFSFEEIPEAQKLMEVGKVVVRVGKKTSEE